MDYMQQGQDVDTEKTIPVWEKFTLSLTEAALYTGIGQHKLCELADNEDCDFIL